MGAGQELLDQRAHGAGTEHHGLHLAAPVQQTVGEDVAAVEVGAELDLVDGEEVDVNVRRHRFDRAHVVARLGRHDLFFAGDQRNGMGSALADHLVIDLPGQEP